MLNAPEIKRFIKPMPAPQPGMMGPGGQGGPEDQSGQQQGMPLQEAPSMPGDNVYRHTHESINPVSQRGENAWSDMATMDQ